MKAEKTLNENERYEKMVFSPLRLELIFRRQFFKNEEYYVLKDPIGLTYFRLLPSETFLVQLLDGDRSLKLVREIFIREYPNSQKSLREIASFCNQLGRAGLLSINAKSFMQIAKDRQPVKQSIFQLWAKLMSKLLFIKVPLIDPSPWLGKLTHRLRFLWSVTFVVVCLLGFIFSGGRLLLNLDAFEHNTISFFTSSNLFLIWACMIFIKTCHEFAHAMTCRHFGSEVHEMGICIICFFLCGYVNASDAWMMRYQRHKIFVTIAGVFVELILASIAAHIWLTLPDGLGRNLAFNAMVIASVNTLVFNMNPLMKFDGYYVISDWLEIPNLRTKAITYCSMHMQLILFGYRNTRQEKMLGGEDHGKVFIIYAICSYVYMAFIIYSLSQLFARYLEPYGLREFGLMVGINTQAIFLGYPMFRILYDAFKPGAHIVRVKPMGQCLAKHAGAFVLIVLFVFCLPTRYQVKGQAFLVPQKTGMVSSLHSGYLDDVYVDTGGWVNEGDLLGKLRNDDLEVMYRNQRNDIQLENLKINRSYNYSQERRQYEHTKSMIDIELSSAQLDEVLAGIEELNLRSTISGYVTTLDFKSKIGSFFRSNEVVVEVENLDELKLVMPVTEDQVELIEVDNQVRGRVLGTGNLLVSHVSEILPNRVSDDFLHLATLKKFGGVLEGPEIEGQDNPHVQRSRHVYYIEALVNIPESLQKGMRVHLTILGKRTTLGRKLWRQACNLWNLKGPTRNPFSQGIVD